MLEVRGLSEGPLCLQGPYLEPWPCVRGGGLWRWRAAYPIISHQSPSHLGGPEAPFASQAMKISIYFESRFLEAGKCMGVI